MAGGAILSAGTSTSLGTGGSTAIGILATGAQTWGGNGEYSAKINAGSGTPGTNWDEVTMSALSVTANGSTSQFGTRRSQR